MIAKHHLVFGPRPRRLGRIPKQLQPNALRLSYSLALLGAVKALHAAIRERLFPLLPTLVEQAGLVHDAESYTERVERELERIAAEWLQQFSNEKLRALAMSFGRRVSAHGRAQLTRQLSAALGREINIDVFAAGANVEKKLREWAAQNALLIRDVGVKARAEVTATTVQGLRAGVRAEDLEESIGQRLQVSESRARLIARDQVGKLNGELNAARQQATGIKGFFWRTVGDERVRDEHDELDGKFFLWTSPPEEGIPGEPINCRCTAEPDIRGFLDEF